MSRGDRSATGADVWESCLVMIETATAEVHAARRRHQREIAERNRLRRLVARVDSVIEACEEAHLQGLKDVPPDLEERSAATLRTARRIVARTGRSEALQVVDEMVRRPCTKIVDVMDALWTVQEVVFDLMLPWRAELPEDVDVSGTPVGPWRYDSAA